MTESQFSSFIKSALRAKSRFWKPISDTIKTARVSKGVYLCNGCKQHVPKSVVIEGKRVNNIFCDHILPVVDVSEGMVGRDKYIRRLFC